MAEAPEAPVVRKRAVPAARPKAAPVAKRPARAKAPPPPPPVLFEEPDAPNYALRLTEGLQDEPTPVADDTFAVRLNEALAAITAANGVASSSPQPAAEPRVPEAPKSLHAWLATLDKLPPIRLPIGPAIPWKIGLPALVALVVLMGLFGRIGGQADSAGVQLPAQQTYPVQQEAPLFATPDATPVATPVTAGQQPIGVAEPAALGGFDLVDVGIKLIAVLGLAYASLMLLKRFGYGGASSTRGGAGPELKVVSSIALAPNRSVHVLQVPGGKTLLIGATPTAVNLLADVSQQQDQVL